MKIDKVLSLFDGMSCGQIALNKLGLTYSTYYASEIDKHAVEVTQHNYPGTVQLGNVMGIHGKDLPEIDLLIGGSPCTNVSVAGKQQGLSTTCHIEITSLGQYLSLKSDGFEFVGQSFLFWEYVRILREIKPTYFLLENVKMANKWKDIFTKELGVEPIEINSQLVSAQHRRRIYWTNIPNISQPEDKNLFLKDIVEHNITGGESVRFNSNGEYNTIAGNKKNIKLTDKIQVPYTIYEARTEEGKAERRRLRVLLGRDTTPRGPKYKIYLPLCTNKANCLVATPSELDKIVDFEYNYRFLTISECEKLQTVPLNYTVVASMRQRRKMLGNGWTVDVIAHIFSHINPASS